MSSGTPALLSRATTTLRLTRSTRCQHSKACRSHHILSNQSRRPIFGKPGYERKQDACPARLCCVDGRKVGSFFSPSLACAHRYVVLQRLSHPSGNQESIYSTRCRQECLRWRDKKGLLRPGQEIPPRYEQGSFREREICRGAVGI